MEGQLFVSLFIPIYFLPSILVSDPKKIHNNKMGVYVLNSLLGWTVLGWIVALIWACKDERKSQDFQRYVASYKPPRD